jgi:hypothetical protein
MAYIEWWNRTKPITMGERFGLNEISIARNTLSPTKSYTEGGRIGFLNPGLVTKGIELAPKVSRAAKYLKDLLTKRPVITGVERTQLKTDFSWDQTFSTKFKEFADKHFAGNWSAASKALGESREKIRGIIQRISPDKSYGKIATGGETLITVDVPKGTKSFTDITTELKYKPEILTEKIKRLVKQKKVSKKNFYNAKDLANILGIDSTDKRAVDSLTQLLKQQNVLTQELTPLIKEYNLIDAANKLKTWSSTKLVKGDVIAMTERLKIEAEWDQSLVRFFDNLKAQTRNLSKEADIFVRNAVEDIGHAQSIKVITKYPNLFKNSNVRSMQTLTYQDPRVNQEIFQNQGFQGIYDSIFKDLNKFVNKKVTKKNIEEINSLRKRLEVNYTNLVKRIKQEAKGNSYFIGQDKRIPELKLADLKIGDTFKSENIFADMSTVDSSYIVGQIFKINPTATKFKDLTPKQIEWYKQNITNQTMDNLEKFYTNVGYRSGEIEELKDALIVGTAVKKGLKEGGRTGFKAAGAVFPYDIIKGITEDPKKTISLAAPIAAGAAIVEPKKASKIVKETSKKAWNLGKQVLSKALGIGFSPTGLAGLLAWHAKGKDAKEIVTSPWTYSYAPFLGVGAEGVEFITKNIKNPAIKSFVQKALSLGVFTPAQIIKASRITTPAGWLAVIGTTLATMPEDKKSVFLKEMNLEPEFEEKLKEEREEYYTEGEHYAEGGIASLIK